MSALDDRLRDLYEQKKALLARLNLVEEEILEVYRMRYQELAR